ncbi:MAG: glycoside hydrolase family 15 protein [Acidimicrobiales bacterium]
MTKPDPRASAPALTDETPFARDLDALERKSVATILASQDRNGAFIASPDFAQYHFCWLRDASFIAYALDRAGEHESSARYHGWVNDTVQSISGIIDDVVASDQRGDAVDPTLMPPARFALDGTSVVDDWPNFQIDGYGTWLWSLGEHLKISGRGGLPHELRDSVARVSRYLGTFALHPCFDVWEESGTAIHTSTLACVFAGLTAAAHLLEDDSLARRAEVVRQRVLTATVPGGHYVKSTLNPDVDSSTLWLATPFALVSGADDAFVRTVAEIESTLTLDGGLRRYAADTYFGSGAWPVLTASLGWHRVNVGDLPGALKCRDWVVAKFHSDGRLGEQFGGEGRDPTHYREWVERWGVPAQNLTWSHAMFVILNEAIRDAEATANRSTSAAGQVPRSQENS